MRILHFADVHLGVENYGRLDPATGLSSRLLDFCRCLDQTIDRALRGDVDLVIFAGDAYRNRDPNPTHQREFARRVHRLSAAGIPTFLLIGNHDLPAATGRANSIDIFETLAVPNVTIGRRFESVRIETRRGPVQIVAIPWINRARLLTRESFRDLSPDEIRREAEEVLAQGILARYDELDPNDISIAVGHLTIEGALFGSERNVLVGDDFVLPRSIVCDNRLDYVALGHIHRHQVVNELPLTLYSGSLERVDFGEEREKKGYVIVDIEKGRATHQFEEVEARRFLTIDVDARGPDPMATVEREVTRHSLTDAVVRVRIATTAEREPLLDLAEIRRLLRDASFVAGIIKQVERENRARISSERIAELTPQAALAAYLQSKNVSVERTERLVRRADELIRGTP